jgi:DNA-binding response OmpR family regulator
MRELILRVSLRINNRGSKEKELDFGTMSILEDKRIVSEDGVNINLTPKEFDLLIFLCKNNNQVFKREQLLNKVWSYDFMGDTRTVDTHIKKLREKIDFCEKNLKTVWGVGYRMEI